MNSYLYEFICSRLSDKSWLKLPLCLSHSLYLYFSLSLCLSHWSYTYA